MKIDFSAPILNIDGAPIKDGDGELTLKTVAYSVLLGTEQADFAASVTEKEDRFDLAVKISSGGIVEIKAEEGALLKRLIGKKCPPLIVGRAFQIIEKSE
ncbi:MAG: hypothetical protein Q8P46_07015 [Hyphomicrobiales bacterium]|nr:hypothetical protein [Hyphomicrobiales bacterium]